MFVITIQISFLHYEVKPCCVPLFCYKLFDTTLVVFHRVFLLLSESQIKQIQRATSCIGVSWWLLISMACVILYCQRIHH